MTSEPPTTSATKPRGDWRRDWRWLLAAGCLALLLIGLIGATGIVALVLGAIKRSDVYREAVARARAHPEVIATLGDPVEPGWWLSGSINVSGPGGEASLAIPLAGPSGAGKLYVEADKAAGEWRFTTLELAPRGGGRRVDLLAAGPGAGAAAEPPEAAGRGVGEITFSRGLTDDGPADAASRFRSPLGTVYASFRLAGLGAEQRLRARWYRGGRLFEEVELALSEAFPGGVPAETGFFVSLDMEQGGDLKPAFYRLELAVDGARARSGAFVVEPADARPRLVNPSFAPAVAEVGPGRRYPLATGYRFAAGTPEVYALFDFFGMAPGERWGWQLRREGEPLAASGPLSWEGPEEGIFALRLPVAGEPGLYDFWLEAGGEAQATDSFVLGASAAPVARLLLEDGFDDPASGWPTTATDAMDARYDAGRYVIRLDQAEAFAWSTLEGRPFGDFVAEVTVLAPAGAEPVEYGILARSQEEPAFHAFLVSTAGEAAVATAADDRFVLSSAWADLPPELRRRDDGPRRLRLLARGPELRFYVDDRLVALVPDARWSSGEVGLIVGSRERPGVQAIFDDFRVWSPAGAAAPPAAAGEVGQ